MAQALSEAYDTALLDLDGVVYAGGNAIAHAVESLASAREGGMRLAYVTNNALRTPGHRGRASHRAGDTDGGRRRHHLGAGGRAADQRAGAGRARVLVIGGEGLRVALRERGLEPVESADDDPAAVVQGFGGPDLPWGRFAEACYAVARGVPWFASNTDLTIPSGRGIAPGNGAAVEVVRIATGAEPQVAGKPLPPMHRETILRTGAKRPLVVGDRLDTDIEGAFNGEVDSLLVLTGVTDGAQLLAAPPQHRPTYVDADLRGMLTGQPEVIEAGRAVPVRRLDGDGRDGRGWSSTVTARRWTGCGRCARRPGRRPGRGRASWTGGRRWRGWGCSPSASARASARGAGAAGARRRRPAAVPARTPRPGRHPNRARMRG